VKVTAQGGKLVAQAVGSRDAYAIRRAGPVELQPVATGEFMVPSRYPMILQFDGTGLTLNPGHWQQVGARVASQ
jgi:hypothetical protein